MKKDKLPTSGNNSEGIIYRGAFLGKVSGKTSLDATVHGRKHLMFGHICEHAQ